LDSLPPATASPQPPASYAHAPAQAPTYPAAPGDIYPRSDRERDLCRTASRPDWLYLAGLVALDAGAIYYGSLSALKWPVHPFGHNPQVTTETSSTADVLVRLTGPAAIGLTWGATVSGVWLALPKCSLEWVGESPREGAVRDSWPVNLSLALLAGATAPIVNAIAAGYTFPSAWTTFERAMHLVTAGVFGFGGAFLPLVLPPSTTAAARELDKIRLGGDGHSFFIGYGTSF
jgi:hypothetical protein